MKMIDRKTIKGKIIIGSAALISTLVLGLTVYVPAAEAGKSAGETLIDGDFEEAMLKHFEKRFYRRIDATEEQQTALSAIFLRQMQGSRAQREAIRHKLLDLTDFIAADGSTDDQIKERIAELRGMRDKLMDSRIDTALKVRAILTPEQRKIIADRISSLLGGNSGMKRRTSGLVE
ncbi:MAG: Spy/CpxP family protein refolding chaperone [Cyanobacteria bacterium SZAS TMP-1]|nr:Spy/CpxP family protein refolding chaperone [Cyanobacteria bacterium SZAS TMP-1]